MPSTMRDERSSNPFMRALDPALEHCVRERYVGTPGMSVVAMLREMKDDGVHLVSTSKQE